MTAGNARRALRSLADDTVAAKQAAKELVKDLAEVPAGDLSWAQRRAAKKVPKKLTWVVVLEISLARLIRDRETWPGPKTTKAYATVVAQETQAIRDLIKKTKEAGDSYVLRPNGTYAWLALNQTRLDELEEMLKQITA